MDLATAFALGVFAASNETIRPLALAVVPMVGFIWYEARRTAEEFCKVRSKPAVPIQKFRRPVPVSPSPTFENEQAPSPKGPIPDSIRQELAEANDEDTNRPSWVDKEVTQQ